MEKERWFLTVSSGAHRALALIERLLLKMEWPSYTVVFQAGAISLESACFSLRLEPVDNHRLPTRTTDGILRLLTSAVLDLRVRFEDGSLIHLQMTESQRIVQTTMETFDDVDAFAERVRASMHQILSNADT